MSTESEFSIDPYEAAAIADLFREADRKFKEGRGTLDEMYAGYAMAFGGLDFARLEYAFRMHGLNAHFLAVPSGPVEKAHPQVMIIDFSDMFFYQRETKRPFVALAFPNADELRGFVDAYSIPYNPIQNLRNLRQAGVFTQRRGFSYQGTPETRAMN